MQIQVDKLLYFVMRYDETFLGVPVSSRLVATLYPNSSDRIVCRVAIWTNIVRFGSGLHQGLYWMNCPCDGNLSPDLGFQITANADKLLQFRAVSEAVILKKLDINCEFNCGTNVKNTYAYTWFRTLDNLPGESIWFPSAITPPPLLPEREWENVDGSVWKLV